MTSSDIRVKTHYNFKYLYNELKNVALGDMHELFFICANLGYRGKQKKSLGSNSEDRFWSSTITPEEWACYYSMVIEDSSMDFTSLKDDKIVINTIEEYANSGMEILIKDILKDYILKGDGPPRLDSSSTKELTKTILHYIFDKMKEQ